MIRELTNKYAEELKNSGIKRPDYIKGVELITLREILEVLKSIDSKLKGEETPEAVVTEESKEVEATVITEKEETITEKKAPTKTTAKK